MGFPCQSVMKETLITRWASFTNLKNLWGPKRSSIFGPPRVWRLIFWRGGTRVPERSDMWCQTVQDACNARFHKLNAVRASAVLSQAPFAGAIPSQPLLPLGTPIQNQSASFDTNYALASLSLQSICFTHLCQHFTLDVVRVCLRLYRRPSSVFVSASSRTPR